MTPLNILHVFRTPFGGLYRHVLDLAREQIARGHRVGLIADSKTGGRLSQETLKELAPSLALGLTRVPYAPVYRSQRRNNSGPCHGAHCRKAPRHCARAWRKRRCLCPPGIQCFPRSQGLYAARRKSSIRRRHDLYLFESAYIADVFLRKIGTPRGFVRIVHNGLSKKEFAPVKARADATDLVSWANSCRSKASMS